MTTYVTNDQLIINANTPEELVANLNMNSMFGNKQGIQQYMEESSKRLKIQFGIDVAIDTPDHYVADLIAYNIIRIVSA